MSMRLVSSMKTPCAGMPAVVCGFWFLMSMRGKRDKPPLERGGGYPRLDGAQGLAIGRRVLGSQCCAGIGRGLGQRTLVGERLREIVEGGRIARRQTQRLPVGSSGARIVALRL